MKDGFMVTNVIPLYFACVGILQDSLDQFNPEDDIYEGISSCIEKLNHYYDKVTPIIGIALILDPSKKKDFFNDLDWKEEWIATVDDTLTNLSIFTVIVLRVLLKHSHNWTSKNLN